MGVLGWHEYPGFGTFYSPMLSKLCNTDQFLTWFSYTRIFMIVGSLNVTLGLSVSKTVTIIIICIVNIDVIEGIF